MGAPKAFDDVHGMAPYANDRPCVTFQQAYDLTNYSGVAGSQKPIIIPLVPGTDSIVLAGYQAPNNLTGGAAIFAFLYLDSTNGIPWGQLNNMNGLYAKPIPVARKGSSLIVVPYGTSGVGILQVTLVRGILSPQMALGAGG